MNKLFTKKIGSKKGFTLAELLIVVAIIAVLAAIAIPLYTTQLTSAKEKVDVSNARAAASIASAQYMLDAPNGKETYNFKIDGVNIVYDDSASAITVNLKKGTGEVVSVDIAASQSTGAAINITAANLAAGKVK